MKATAEAFLSRYFPTAFTRLQTMRNRKKFGGIARYAFKGKDIRGDISTRYGYQGDLLDIYTSGSAQLVHKWHHYLPIYERYFSKWRGKPVRFLEIGVYRGGSLSMWRKYFGEAAIIYGIDIDENCAQYDGIDGSVRIGSQDDPEFLKSILAEMGGVDVVLDDGSHTMEHIRATLETLLPLVEEGGTYMIEDLHTAYWKNYGGGFTSKANFFNYVRALVDDLHRWYHVYDLQHPGVSNHCGSIHIHDSICVIEKEALQKPTHSKVQSDLEKRTDPAP